MAEAPPLPPWQKATTVAAINTLVLVLFTALRVEVYVIQALVVLSLFPWAALFMHFAYEAKANAVEKGLILAVAARKEAKIAEEARFRVCRRCGRRVPISFWEVIDRDDGEPTIEGCLRCLRGRDYPPEDEDTPPPIIAIIGLGSSPEFLPPKADDIFEAIRPTSEDIGEE